MAKTVSQTQGNAANRSSSPASITTASQHDGSVTATTTARITLMSWREFVVRDGVLSDFRVDGGWFPF